MKPNERIRRASPYTRCRRCLTGWLALALVVVGNAGTHAADEQGQFPFVLPWDDASPGIVNIGSWLSRPAGAEGAVRSGPDGHFYSGDKRMRFLGVNTCFGANFPTKADAPKIAARMARFGINAVRFHHMDMNRFPAGIREQNGSGTGGLDPEALDRLDFFISELKKQGIYSNINLLVSRPFNSADGLPKAIEQVGWKERHVVGFFDKAVVELQKQYAQKLLGHRNPYTQSTYAEEPAVAFVEINNENGLLQAWLSNQVDRLPELFRDELREQWNAWLQRKYTMTAALRKAWQAPSQPLGDELLENRDFSRGKERWVLETHGQAKAVADPFDDVPPQMRETFPNSKSIRIEVNAPGEKNWYVQFMQDGFAVAHGRPLTLSFWAKADQSQRVAVNLIQAHEPWQALGFEASFAVSNQWKRFDYVFAPNADEPNARLSFTNLATKKCTVWIAGVSLRRGGTIGLALDQKLESKSIPIIAHAGFHRQSIPVQEDWIRFLWETENTYWETMRRFVKDELKVRAIVIGTIIGCSTPNLMAPFDATDSHAYWQHPQFPKRSWDPDNWIVKNESMVNVQGGTLPGLAMRRLLNKPHCVTEYNHSAPNTFSSEAFLLLAAYGALQDWDALFAFSYSHRTDNWGQRFFDNFFDIDQNPAKMATLIPAAAMFVRGDIQQSGAQLIVPIPKTRELDAIRNSAAWSLVSASSAGVPGVAALQQRVAITTEERPLPDLSRFDRKAVRSVSDTGELTWDRSEKDRGVVTVNSPRSKAMIGYGQGRRFELGALTLEPMSSQQNGWSAITATQMAAKPEHWLITATGYTDNTELKWNNASQDSVGRQWGKAPSRVEGVAAKLRFSNVKGAKAWALDERGQRRAQVDVALTNDAATINIDVKYQTLWYEIVLDPPGP